MTEEQLRKVVTGAQVLSEELLAVLAETETEPDAVTYANLLCQAHMIAAVRLMAPVAALTVRVTGESIESVTKSILEPLRKDLIINVKRHLAYAKGENNGPVQRN